MTKEEFYSKYANTPIVMRYQVLDWNGFGSMTLASLFKEVEELEARIYETKQRQLKLIEAAESFWKPK